MSLLQNPTSLPQNPLSFEDVPTPISQKFPHDTRVSKKFPQHTIHDTRVSYTQTNMFIIIYSYSYTHILIYSFTHILIYSYTHILILIDFYSHTYTHITILIYPHCKKNAGMDPL